MENSDPLLQVKNLRTYFYTEDGVVKAVEMVSILTFFRGNFRACR
jgi:ABC-type dipeptide/oligopeptide/nickel transport system ATPase component